MIKNETRLDEPRQGANQEPKQKAYASDLTDTLAQKMGKNQLQSYTQQQLFTDDAYGRWVYLSDDGRTEITTDLDGDKTLPLEISPTTEKILLLLLSKLAENFGGANRVYLENISANDMSEKTTIAVSLQEYMQRVGIKHSNTARANLKRASDELFSKVIKHTFYITEKTKTRSGKERTTRKPHVEIDMRLLDGRVRFRNGNVIFAFNQRIAKYLTEYSEPFNDRLLQTNTHDYPHAFKIGHYLNRQYARTAKATNNGKLRVSKILDNCDIPKADGVANRKYREKIKEPLLNTLDYLKDEKIIADYSFYDTAGKEYSRYESINLPITQFMGLILNYAMV